MAGMPAWLRLAIGGAATLLVGMGIGRFSYAPLIPALIEAGELSAAEAGTVGAFNLAGFLAGALAAPALKARRGEAASLRICLLAALLCLVASIAPWGFAWLALWRFGVGAAAAVMMVYALSMVTRAAPPERLGAATGIVFTGVGGGILVAGTVVPVLLGIGVAAAWTGLALIGAVGAAVAFWGWGAAGAEAPTPRARAPRPAEPWPRWTLAVGGLVAAQTLFSFGVIPHTIYWVDYVVRGLGRDMAEGGTHWALFGAGAMAGTYLWGRLADRIGFGAALVLAFAALAAGVFLPVAYPANWALVLSSLVVGAQPGFSAILSGRTHQLVGARRMAGVWRRMTLVGGIGQAVGGYALVALFATAGSHGPVFLIGGGALALGALVALGLLGRAESPREHG